MNTRQITLRNREVNLKPDNTIKRDYKGVTTRKRAALKPLNDVEIKENDNKVVLCSKPISKIGKDVVKDECKPEPMDISIDYKVNESLTYEYLIKNPISWPTASNLTNSSQQTELLNMVKSRRTVIRRHYRHLNNNGRPIWYPGENSYSDQFMHAEYLANINEHIAESECTCLPLGKNFLENSLEVGPRQRYVFVDFMVSHHAQFEIGAETLQLAICMSDKFIKAKKSALKTDDLIVVGLICLFIASKMEEVFPPTLIEILGDKIEDYPVSFCKQLELQIISALDCQLTMPMPICFIRYYQCLIKTTPLFHYLSRYFCELSLQDYEASGHSYTMVASSCVFLALVISRNVESDFHLIWDETLQTASGLLYTDIKPLVLNLCIIVHKQQSPSAYRAISTKYSNERFMNVYARSLTSPAYRKLIQMFKSELSNR